MAAHRYPKAPLTWRLFLRVFRIEEGFPRKHRPNTSNKVLARISLQNKAIAPGHAQHALQPLVRMRRKHQNAGGNSTLPNLVRGRKSARPRHNQIEDDE